MTPSDWTSTELLKACLDTSSQAAWMEFVRRYQPVISGVIGRIASRCGARHDPSLIDDLVQDTYIRLCRDQCRLLRQFKPESEDSFFGYAKVVASSVALDHFRTQSADKRGPQSTPLDAAAERSVASFHPLNRPRPPIEHQVIQQDLWTHIDRIAEGERDVTILRLYFQQGFTSREIAQLQWIGLSEKGVESCLTRLVARLRDALPSNNSVSKGNSRPTAF